ncbi:MAG: peptidylprolyl isomerase [Planctomycetota bacterium]
MADQRTARRSTHKAVGLWATATATMLCAIGCASSNDQAAPRTQVQAGDFAGQPSGTPDNRVAQETPIESIDRTEALGGEDDTVLTVGSPERRAVDQTYANVEDRGSIVVDRLVGQMNGRPLYASEFFEPMDTRFKREAERLGTQEWLQMASKDIQAALYDQLRDELLLAEFQSTLRPEERIGVLAFITSIREQVVSGNLGAESLANQRLLEREGRTLDEKIQDIADRQFIAEQLRREIGGRVNVSYREVRQYYERNRAEFNPPPTAMLTNVRVPARNTERIDRIAARLGAGDDFFDIVNDETERGRFFAQQYEAELKDAPYSEARLYGPDPLNDAARRLAPGETTPRIDFQGFAWWIHLERFEQPKGKSLYEAQLEIEQKLLGDRQTEELERYLTEIFGRGSFTNIREMQTALLEFAALRYLGQPEG